MTTETATPAADTGLPDHPVRSLDDLQTDASVIHGLIIALEMCDNFRGGSDDRRAVNAMGSIMIALDAMADRLANDLDRLDRGAGA